MELLIAVVVALGMALIAIVLFEFWVNPRLEVRRAEPHAEVFDYPPDNLTMTFIRVMVINKPIT